MRWSPRTVLSPPAQSAVTRVTDPRERRGIIIELSIVGALTFGMSAARAILYSIERELTGGIAGTTVALNPSQSSIETIDALGQLLSVLRMVAIAALGGYLLWRSGLLERAGLTRLRLGRSQPGSRWRGDVPIGLGLAALIGLPGLALVAASSIFDWNSTIEASRVDAAWWEWGVWVLNAAGNGLSEEIIVVAYFLTRLRQLGFSENHALLASATLRASYHLYQGFGAGVGNFLMGLIFGRFYQLTNRVWPLVVAHTVIDVVAFIGYALLAGHVSWL